MRLAAETAIRCRITVSSEVSVRDSGRLVKFISVPQAVDASVPSAHLQDEESDKPPVVTGPVPTWPGYQLQPHENICSEPRCCGYILLAYPRLLLPGLAVGSRWAQGGPGLLAAAPWDTCTGPLVTSSTASLWGGGLPPTHQP